jgi:MoxR-like ATPase
MRIFLQRGSAKGYVENVKKTLASSLSPEKLARLVEILAKAEAEEEVQDILAGGGKVYAWGSKRYARNEIHKMQPGAVVVFLVRGDPKYYGVVTRVLGDEIELPVRQGLSSELWQDDVWEYIWFMEDVRPPAPSTEELEGYLGRRLDNTFFGGGSFRGMDLRDAPHESGRNLLRFLETGEGPKVTITREDEEDPEIARMRKLLAEKKQLILYGPPGTGKTYMAMKLAKEVAEEDTISIVQFHPSYSYEEFVVGLKPMVEEGQLSFRPVDGAFKRLCDRARENPDRPYVMVVDEINRGNIPKIFGELLLLLEYRDKEVHLPYVPSDETWGIPVNFFLIGTMNTADRSIALIDVALRRRFYFVEMTPDYELLEGWLMERSTEEMAHLVVKLLQTMNARITRLVDRHHEIGHTYFMRDGMDWPKLRTVMYHEVIPLLEEYFYNEPQQLLAVLGPGFIVEPREEVELGGSFYVLVPNREISEFRDAIDLLLSYQASSLLRP